MSPNGLSALLVLSAAALLGLGAVELEYASAGDAGAAAAPAPDLAPVPEAPVPSFQLPPIATLDETLERPLFVANRRVPEPLAESTPEPPSRAPRPRADRFALSAIVIVDDERIALLRDSATGGLSRVREGETVSGWRVEAIGEESVVLASGDTREELALRTFEAPPPVAPRRPPAADAAARARATQNQARDDLRRPRRPRRGPGAAARRSDEPSR